MPTIITPTPPKPFIAYTAQELKTLYPDAFDTALERHKESEYQDPYYGQEVWDSYKALIDELGLEMSDYSFDYFDSYRNRIRFRDSDALELEGVRAYKYVINKLSKHIDNDWIPFISELQLPPFNFVQSDTVKSRVARRKQPWGKPWVKNDCPLTGVCYDDMLIDKLTSYLLKAKVSLREALSWVMDEATNLIEQEYYSRCTEAYFLEECSERDVLFTESGEEVTNHGN